MTRQYLVSVNHNFGTIGYAVK